MNRVGLWLIASQSAVFHPNTVTTHLAQCHWKIPQSSGWRDGRFHDCTPFSVGPGGASGGQRRLAGTPGSSEGSPTLLLLLLIQILSKGPNLGCHALWTEGLEGRGVSSETPISLTMYQSVSPAKSPPLHLAGSLYPGTQRRQLWWNGTGQNTKRTYSATTWTAAWWDPTSGSLATTSPSATTGVAPLPAVLRPQITAWGDSSRNKTEIGASGH